MITILDQAVNILNYLNYRKHIVEEPAIKSMCTKRNETLQTLQHIAAGRQVQGRGNISGGKIS